MSSQPHRVPRPAGSVTERIASTLREFRYETVPAHAVALAKHCLLDYLGVTIAGSREPAAQIVRAEAEAESAGGACTVVGSHLRLGPMWAALANGTASHALDFDDVVHTMAGHPTVPIMPALLALAEAEPRASGREFLAAFIAGFEAECRIGAYIGPSHYARGFHVTSTVGTFGAAAACAHWLGLPLREWQTAFGLAGTQAAGLKSMFGTMTKPFHAGRAAASGLLATRLAARGFTAHPEVLDVDQGFITTQSEGVNDAALDDLGRTFGITGVLFKYHAACYLTHAGIEALLKLRADHRLDPAKIAAVRLRVAPGHLRVCNIEKPTTALEAKFSLRFTAAMALTTGDTSERAFTEDCVRDVRLTSLADKVTVQPVPTLPHTYISEVEIALADGTTLRGIGDASRSAGPGELDRQWARLEAKCRSLAEPVIGRARTDALVESVATLEDCTDLPAFIRSLAEPAR